MLRAVADTHAVIWYLYDDPRLSKPARDTIKEAGASGDQIGLSVITLAEIVYLSEKGRIHPAVFGRLLATLDRSGSVLVDLPFDRNVAAALGEIDRSSVPDLPDRLIAATAFLYRVPIISRDRRIQTSGVPTIW